MQLTLDAFAPLGTNYVEALRKGYRRALGRLHAEHRQEPGRLHATRPTACTRTSC